MTLFTAEMANQHNAQLIAEAQEYRLVKSFRRAARRGHAKGRAEDRIPDTRKAKVA
jgi:hypothetical protein